MIYGPHLETKLCTAISILSEEDNNLNPRDITVFCKDISHLQSHSKFNSNRPSQQVKNCTNSQRRLSLGVRCQAL